MKKTLQKMTALVCVLVLAAAVAGCGEKAAPADETETVDLQALQKAMLEADTTLPEMKAATSDDEQAKLNFSAFSDFSYDRVQSYFYAYAKEGGVQEIAVVELKDANDAAALMDTMHKHLEERRGALAAYAPDQVQLIEHAVIKQKGKCVAMIISEKSGLVQQAFEAN